MKRGIILSVAAIIIIGALIIIIATNMAVKTPELAVSEFYADWMNGKYSLTDESYINADVLSDGVKENIKTTISSLSSGAYDPIVCAQEAPQSVQIVPISIGETTADLSVRETFQSIVKDIRVSLIREKSIWKITNIICGDAPKQATTNSAFEKTGNIKKNNGGWILVYEEPGKPALSAILDFSDWRCGDSDRCIPSFSEGARMKITGKKINENTVLVDSATEIN